MGTFSEIYLNNILKEDATNQAIKWGITGMVPFGTAIQNAVVNKRINDFYYACNELPTKELIKQCQEEMKQEYINILKDNNLNTTYNQNPMRDAGVPISIVRGLAGSMAANMSGPAMPFVKAGYGQNVENKINDMSYTCDSLVAPKAIEDCKQRMLKKKIDTLTNLGQ